MKKRTSNLSRRIVSLLMSMVLTLTLVTPAAFAEGDMPDNGQQQEQQVPTDAGYPRGLCYGGGGRQQHDHRRGRYEPG